MTYQELKDEEQLYLMHTYGRFPAALDHGKGATLWDIDGKKYIDLTSGIGVSSLGHDNEALVSALNEQAHKLLHASNLYLTEPMVQVAKELVTSCGMGKIFFSNSGAEANEGMIKLARKYSYDKYGEGRNKIITLKQSFHGRTVTTLKATGQEKFHQYFYPFTEGFDYAAANDIEELKDKADDSVCAVMIELIQGEGGVLPLDKEYVQQAAEFCRAKDILFLIDEVQTGIGRTGSLFCYEQYGVKPDVVSMAKGLGGGVPVGAVMASEICADVLGAGTHGTTFGGNPFCCAAARTVLSVLAIGSDKIKTVRGMGLMLGIVVDKESRAEMVNRLLEKGVLALTAGEETIRLLPPLVISYEEMDSAVAVIKEVF